MESVKYLYISYTTKYNRKFLYTHGDNTLYMKHPSKVFNQNIVESQASLCVKVIESNNNATVVNTLINEKPSILVEIIKEDYQDEFEEEITYEFIKNSLKDEFIIESIDSKRVINKIIIDHVRKYIEIRRKYLLNEIYISSQNKQTSGYTIYEDKYEEFVDYVDYSREFTNNIKNTKGEKKKVKKARRIINNKTLSCVEICNQMKNDIVDKKAMDEENI